MISTEGAIGNGSSNLCSMLQVEINLYHITISWIPLSFMISERENPSAFLWNQEFNRKSVKSGI